MSVLPGFPVPSARPLPATTGAGLPGICRTARPTALTSAVALALAPAFPLALSSPVGLRARHADTTARRRPGRISAGDRSGLWLRNAAGGLCMLAAAAAAVSFTAQYRMVDATRHLPAVAALEAAIPDAAALVFACLGVALALCGRRAVRARVLNLASVGASVFMNVIAAAAGWRNLAIWAMPPVAYALASDTLIGVVRTWAIAGQHPGGTGAGDTATPLSALGRLVLWLLRLALAPVSTLAGFRAWVLTQCPVTPARRAAAPPFIATPPGRLPAPQRVGVTRETKTARFLSLVTERHGSLAAVPLAATAQIAADLAPQVNLNPGAARTALRNAVLSSRNGDPR
jgi:hypothetical protein